MLADYSRYSVENLDRYTGRSFGAVRACFFKNEREQMIPFCKEIKDKGYKLFIQPVDIMGYSDKELLELIEKVNALEPYCFSVVDTFGSMYMDDLRRIYCLIHHNLVNGCKIGFHSHNNMQLSNALSQEFARMSYGQRDVVIDATISGMGRGAGNTPTELVVQYLISKMGYNYDMDAILDVIDSFMPNIRTKCSWGYSTRYFIAGSYGAHVNNISFLNQKNSISSKDMRFVLNKIGAERRKRYDYKLLEETYLDYLKSDVDDSEALKKLRAELRGRNVVIIAPGISSKNTDEIENYVDEKNAVAICINFVPANVSCQYLYVSNIARYNVLKNTREFSEIRKIVTSNIPCNEKEVYRIKFSRLIKCGWEYIDNSTLMLLRLLDYLEVASVGIAGLDGYETGKKSYISDDMEIWHEEEPQKINDEIASMLSDYMSSKKHDFEVSFITQSRFSSCLE